MRISLITVARNASATIADTIRSVGTQRGVEIEHLLVDGASSDETIATAERHAKYPLYVVSERDHGIYDAMNKGVRLATGEIIGLLNADDYLAHPNVLTEVRAAFAARSDLMGCYADLVYVHRAAPEKIVRHWKSTAFKPGLFATGWVPPHPTLYVRREVYERIGGFDVSYRLAADFEFMLRMLEIHRLPAVHVADVWVRMRLGGATSRDWRSVLANNREIARALRTHGIGWGPFTQTCRMLRRVPQFFFRLR